MKISTDQLESLAQATLDRRKFFRQAGMLGLGAAASGLVLSGTPARAKDYETEDTVAEIFTAALIAEDLATTFYYNVLVGSVIQDPNLAGPGGNAIHPNPTTGNPGNVDYLRAAVQEEFLHANFFRTALTGSASGASSDPYQTFYFPAGTFDKLSSFLSILNALENAFIGAYLVATQTFAAKAAAAAAGTLTGADAKYSATDYALFAKIAASILGVEAEHRVLGRVIGNENPANNLAYEQADGLTAVYNGPNSAVVALTPFLTPSTGPGYTLATALANWHPLALPAQGGPPTA